MNVVKALSIATIIYIVFLAVIAFECVNNVNPKQAQYDSLEAQINSRNAIIDSLFKREAVIIEQHQHNTKKYYENYYTIITANDSATKSSLFEGLARFEYLHFDTPSQNNQPHN